MPEQVVDPACSDVAGQQLGCRRGSGCWSLGDALQRSHALIHSSVCLPTPLGLAHSEPSLGAQASELGMPAVSIWLDI